MFLLASLAWAFSGPRATAEENTPFFFSGGNSLRAEEKEVGMKVVFAGKVFAAIIMLSLVGCMSLEERLASNDPAVRRAAELELISSSRRSGSESDRVAAINRVTTVDLLVAVAIAAEPAKQQGAGIVPSTLPDGMAALEKISDQELLSKVASSAEAKEIRVKAGEKITKRDLLLPVYQNAQDVEVRLDMLRKMPTELVSQIKYNADLIPFWQKVNDQRTLAQIYRDGNAKLSQEECEALAGKIIDESVLEEMVIAPGREKKERERVQRDSRKSELKYQIAGARRQSEEWASSARQSKNNWRLKDAEKEERKAREFEAQAVKLQKELLAVEAEGSSFLYVSNETGRVRLYRKINEARLVAMAKERVASQSFEDWNHEKIDGFLAATEMLPFLTDRHEIGQIAYSILATLYNFRAKCYGGALYGYRWGEKDRQMAQAIEEKVAAVLDDDIIMKLIRENPRAWRTLSGMIKDRSVASELAEELIETARQDGNDEKVKDCFKECGNALRTTN